MEKGSAAILDGAAAEERLPIDALDFLWLELTPHCNLTCIHCYADSNPQRPLHEKMEQRDWIEALSQAAELGCRGVQFIGGEPTLYPGLVGLIEHARSLNFSTIEVFTNGTTLTKRLKDAFELHGVSLAFSLYSAQEEVHDAVVQQKGSLAKTKMAIHWALGAGLKVRAAVIVMEANSGHEDATRRMLEGLGVASIRVDRVRGVGRGSREVAAESSLGELCGACGKGQLCVSSDGQAYPCVFSRAWPMGSVSAGLRTIIGKKELHDFRGELRAARAIRQAAECSPEKDPGPCGPEKDPGPCGPEKNPGPCGPEKNPGPCGPDKDPGPCGPEGPCQPAACTPEQNLKSTASECGPEKPAPICGPEKPAPICGPEKPAPICGPEKPSPICGPERPAPICGPEKPACSPDACAPERV
jgi:MoaA/NifB/PqqE/SkfB family radical SAM enzyme